MQSLGLLILFCVRRASVLLNRASTPVWCGCAFLLWTLTLPPVAGYLEFAVCLSFFHIVCQALALSFPSQAGRQQPAWLPLKEASTVSELVAAGSTLQLKLQADFLQQSLHHSGTEGDSRRGILVAAGGRDMLASTLAVMKVNHSPLSVPGKACQCAQHSF